MRVAPKGRMLHESGDGAEWSDSPRARSRFNVLYR
jgi:hypothetical protein